LSLQKRRNRITLNRLIEALLRLPSVIPPQVLTKLSNLPGLRKVYYVFLRRFTSETMVEVQGNKLYLIPSASGVELSLFLYRQHEKAKTRQFNQLIKKGMTVLDLGAHIGYYTLLAAKLVGPEGKVFAFEAAPENFYFLKRNVELNQYHNINLIQKAVSDKTGEATFYLDSESWGHSLAPLVKSKKSITVSTISLDDFLQDDIVVDFVKINIEGAEGRAINGMNRLLRKGNTKYIMVDFHLNELETQGSSFKGTWDDLTTLGFLFYDMRGNKTRLVSFEEAVYLAGKREGGIHLLGLRN